MRLLSVERFPPWRFICALMYASLSPSNANVVRIYTSPCTLTRRVRRATRPSVTPPASVSRSGHTARSRVALNVMPDRGPVTRDSAVQVSIPATSAMPINKECSDWRWLRSDTWRLQRRWMLRRSVAAAALARGTPGAPRPLRMSECVAPGALGPRRTASVAARAAAARAATARKVRAVTPRSPLLLKRQGGHRAGGVPPVFWPAFAPCPSPPWALRWQHGGAQTEGLAYSHMHRRAPSWAARTCRTCAAPQEHRARCECQSVSPQDELQAPQEHWAHEGLPVRLVPSHCCPHRCHRPP